MSSHIRSLLTKLFGSPEYRVLILGFDATGKTSILYKLKLNEFVCTIPTIGFNVETVAYENVSLTMWDVGGCDKIRPLIRYYFENTKGVIFVVDSQDDCQIRQSEVKDELWRIFNDETLASVPVLIYLNKVDMESGLQKENVIKHLKLSEVTGRQWFVQPCSAKTGEGLYNGLNWLVRVLKSPSTALGHEVSSNETGDSHFEEKSLQWLSQVDEDSIEEFIEKFKKQNVSPFDHRASLRAIWSYLKTYGRKATLDIIFNDIKANNANWNETLTYFWIQIVHYALETMKNPTNDFVGFLLMNPQLLNESELPLAYYKKETLFSEQAKESFVLPDVKQLPNVLPTPATISTHSNSAKNQHQDEPLCEMTDDEFLSLFESCTLTNWSHKTHLRMAWLYLSRNDRRTAVNKIFDGIKNFIQNSPIARKTTFHFTMTYFWIQMIDLAIAQSPKGLSFEAFLSLNSHLMNGGLFLEYYKKETLLNNPIARKEMVLPDIKPLPTIVKK
ncbi:ADP-ribosylation factor [Pseudolycoriella hygida]|uniref:ADP-ribosylation factor n=1 Tax=Pseudolycoriella hygida TaxID=35572 RepID=A0A9Q0MP05_9DIPT|nr:ADP-ribosylation factor [Pseudolycoriella hygida]